MKQMIDDSQKKFDRIMAILVQLQSKRVVKAQEIAERFNVSLRTVYRDINTLGAAGVPISSEAGVGYSIVEGYKLPPVMFTKEEATAFIAAEKLMQHFADKSLGGYFTSAMFKVKSVLRWDEKDLVEKLDARIMVQPKEFLFHKSVSNALEVLMEGIVKKKQVNVLYQSFEAEAPAERALEPIGLHHENNFWYLTAYCLLRADYRKFRTDRISKISLLDESFTKQHQELSFYLNEKNETPKTTIKILVDKKVTKYLATTKKYYGFVKEEEEKNGSVLMTFEMPGDDQEYFIRWYVMFGDHAKIIEPTDLKEKTNNLLQKISSRL